MSVQWNHGDEMQQRPIPTTARAKGGSSDNIPARTRIQASSLVQYTAVIIKEPPITMYNSESCMTRCCRKAPERQISSFFLTDRVSPNLISPLLYLSRYSSLLLSAISSHTSLVLGRRSPNGLV